MKRIKDFQQYINESVNEKAVSADEVLSSESQTGAVKIQKKKGSKEVLEIMLYNFDAVGHNRVEGFLEMEKFRGDDVWMVVKSYAIDKHGPLMYNLGLSVVSPQGVIPDRTIKPRAQAVWDYFTKQRPDVKKTELKQGVDDWYATEFDADIEHEHLKTPEVLKLLNTSYSLDKPMEHTEELFKKGEELMEKYKIKPAEIYKRAHAAFWEIYINEE